MSDDDVTLSGCLWMVAAMPLMATAIWCADGFVLSKLWGWHAAPLGAPAVPWVTFVAARIAWAVMRNDVGDHKDNRSELEKARAILVALILPWCGLLIGWWLR